MRILLILMTAIMIGFGSMAYARDPYYSSHYPELPRLPSIGRDSDYPMQSFPTTVVPSSRYSILNGEGTASKMLRQNMQEIEMMNRMRMYELMYR